MRMRAPALALVAIAMAAAAMAAPASAASLTEQLMRDCYDGLVEKDFPRAEMHRALRSLPADSAEYGLCRDALDAALLAGPGGAGKAGKAAAAASPDLNGDGQVTPAERRIAKRQRARARREQRERRQAASAGPDSALEVDEPDEGHMPTPLLLALIALGGGGIVGGVCFAARHNTTVADALRRLRS